MRRERKCRDCGSTKHVEFIDGYGYLCSDCRTTIEEKVRQNKVNPFNDDRKERRG